MAVKEKFQEYSEKFVENSKQGLKKAGKAISKFGDDSITRIEKHQYENQLKEEFQALGELLFNFVNENPQKYDLAETPLQEKIAKITEIKNEIKAKENLLKKKEE